MLDAPGDGPLADDSGGEIQVRDRSPPDAGGGRCGVDAWGSWGEQRERIIGRGMQAGKATKIMSLGLDPILAQVGE